MAPPPLPPIANATLYRRVFTHTGLPNDNTVLALLGDAVLGACVAEYLMTELPADRNTKGGITVCSLSLCVVGLVFS